MKKIFLHLLSSLLITTCFAQGTGKIMLTEGQKFIQETTGNVVLGQEIMGQTMESKIDLKTTNTIEVKDVLDTSYSLVTTITKMKMAMNAMGQNMNYDSDSTNNDSLMGKNMSMLLNNPQNFYINKLGKLVSQEGDSSTGFEGNAMLSGLQSVLGSPDAFLAIPLKTEVGYNWIDSVSKNDTKSNIVYTIKELKGDEIIVSQKGTLRMSGKTEAQGMEFTNNSTGTLTGELIIDRKTGIVKERNTTVETTGTVDIMGQQIPMTTKVTSETTVKSM